MVIIQLVYAIRVLFYVLMDGEINIIIVVSIYVLVQHLGIRLEIIQLNSVLNCAHLVYTPTAILELDNVFLSARVFMIHMETLQALMILLEITKREGVKLIAKPRVNLLIGKLIDAKLDVLEIQHQQLYQHIPIIKIKDVLYLWHVQFCQISFMEIIVHEHALLNVTQMHLLLNGQIILQEHAYLNVTIL